MTKGTNNLLNKAVFYLNGMLKWHSRYYKGDADNVDHYAYDLQWRVRHVIECILRRIDRDLNQVQADRLAEDMFFQFDAIDAIAGALPNREHKYLFFWLNAMVQNSCIKWYHMHVNDNPLNPDYLLRYPKPEYDDYEDKAIAYFGRYVEHH